MADKNEAYNLYRLSFSQPGNADHEALALVDTSLTDQNQGVLHHVTGLMAMGMDYKPRVSKDFRAERGYYKQLKIGMIIGAAGKQGFESVCRSIEPPYVPELLFESREKLEEDRAGRKLRDCAVWIDEVVSKLLEISVLVPSNEEDGPEKVATASQQEES